MLTLNEHHHPLGLKELNEGVRDLLREALLHLEALGEDVDLMLALWLNLADCLSKALEGLSRL